MYFGFLGDFVTDQGRYFNAVIGNNEFEIRFQMDDSIADLKETCLVDIASNSVNFKGSDETDFLGTGFLEQLVVPTLNLTLEAGVGKAMGFKVILVKMFLHQGLSKDKRIDGNTGLYLAGGGIQNRGHGVASGLDIVFDDSISHKMGRSGPGHVFVLSQQFGGTDAQKKEGAGKGGNRGMVHEVDGIGLREIDEYAAVHGGAARQIIVAGAQAFAS